MKRLFAVSVISLLAFASLAFAQERRFTIDDLLKVRRVSDPQVSPKGDLVAFTITDAKIIAIDLIDDPGRIAEADLAILGR